MYQYGPGQPDPGQNPPNAGQQYSPYQPAPEQQGAAYPPPGPDQGGGQFPPPDPAGPPQSSPPFGSQPPPYDPAMTSGPPSAPVTGAGPMDQPPMGPPPMGPPPASGGGKGPWIPLLAGGMALFLIASVVMTVLFFNTRSSLHDEQDSVASLKKQVESLEGDNAELQDKVTALELDLDAAEMAAEDAEGLQTCLDSIKELFDLLEEDASDSKIDDAALQADTDCFLYW